MIAIKTLVVTASSTLALAAAAGFTFFENAHFAGGNTVSVEVNDWNVCYDLGCFDDKASSVQWRDLPTHMSITFFVDKECTGASRTWAVNGPFPADFQIDGINDQVTSFYVFPQDNKAISRRQLACPYRRLEDSPASRNATQPTASEAANTPMA